MIKKLAAFWFVVGVGTSVPALALPSACANLPDGVNTTVAGPDITTPAKTNWKGQPYCSGDFRLIWTGPVATCRKPGPDVNVTVHPKAACYQNTAFGVDQGSLAAPRPTPTCGTKRRIVNLSIRGTNIGFDDVQMSIPSVQGVDVTHLSASGPTIAPSNDPLQSGCMPWNCRYVKVVTTSAAPASFPITLSMPEHSNRVVTVDLNASCPDICVTEQLPGLTANSRRIVTTCRPDI
jgi:hypothetical protein